MKRAGASRRSCSGSGCGRRRTRPCMPFCLGVGWRKPPRSLASTMPACSSTTGGTRIALSRRAHQTCLAHLLRRCRVLLLDYPDSPFVRTAKQILQAALGTREAHHAGTVSAHGLAVARGQYVERLGRLLGRQASRHTAIVRFQQHLIDQFRPSSVFCSSRPSMPPIGAPSRRFDPLSSPARRVAAGIARGAGPIVNRSSPVSSAPPPSATWMPPTCSSRSSPPPRPPCRPHCAPRYYPLNTHLPTPNTQSEPHRPKPKAQRIKVGRWELGVVGSW